MIPWYYMTRLLGIAMVLYGILFDHSPERGTIILSGAGFVGFDKVARSDEKK
jgi:hypothetical protein